MRYIISSALSILPMSWLPLAAWAEVPRVITDIPPVYGLVAEVMGALGTPVLLLEKGADEHDFALRPSQMADITAADLAVWVGPELTPWMERALEGTKEGAVSLPLLHSDGTYRQEFAAPHDGSHEHEEEGHADEEHAEDGHGDTHDHTGLDPHAWLDPHNGRLWLRHIAAALAKADPANAATYAANASAAADKIGALEAELVAMLAPAKGKGFVAYHDAYGYFAAHFGLDYDGAIALGDASSAGVAHIQDVQAQIAGGVICVFPEVQHDAALLLQLLMGTSAKAGLALDPAGALIGAVPTAYADTLRGLANNLAACLNGA